MSARPKRGRSRNFNFDAIQHVGNDADEGGFLGDAEAEASRHQTPSAAAAVKPVPEEAHSVPAQAPAPAVPTRVSSRAKAVKAPSPEVESAAPVEESADSPHDAAVTQPLVESEPEEQEEQEEAAGGGESAEAQTPRPAEASTPATSPERSTVGSALKPVVGRRVNDSAAFSPLSAAPPIESTKPKRAPKKPTPCQDALLDSFISQRTARNWQTWSGRMLPDLLARLKDRADHDAETSGRGRLNPGHYVDAAMRLLPVDPAEQTKVANEWLVRRWAGEHPPGRSAQFGVSPEVAEFMKSLKRTLRKERHGIVIDLMSAATDNFLDRLDEEGPLER
ncbi:hypothetical protein [Streptomyces sp. HUAS TT7]|uniref:hypothetical protein n=1 Tax=Streptomyces sp. HUAS TT7 TaxID=3447507 RepID=UPI003F65D975